MALEDTSRKENKMQRLFLWTGGEGYTPFQSLGQTRITTAIQLPVSDFRISFYKNLLSIVNYFIESGGIVRLLFQPQRRNHLGGRSQREHLGGRSASGTNQPRYQNEDNY
jgi:hypothetical protein